MRAARLALLALIGTLLVAPPASATPPVEPAPSTVRLSVMSLNIFYGGDDYDLSARDWCPVANRCPEGLYRLAKIIESSGADVVGVQEPERNTRKLADVLGWHASPQAHVISRFPILDPPNSHGLFTYVMPIPGQVVAVANVHLPSTPYGPYQVRKGWSREQVLALERTLRVPALRAVLRALRVLELGGVPVFLTGDFNSPSHLDWTAEVAASRPEVAYAVPWPVSKVLADAGFSDSYRDAHPDPVQDPGYTWSPGGPETLANDFFDRIDWVLHSGASTTVSSRLVGERGNPQVDLAFARPFPTDHRGVVSTFDVTPRKSPLMVSPEQRRVVAGEQPLRVRFHAAGKPDEEISLVRLFAPRNLPRPVPTQGRTDGVVELDTAGLRPGLYEVLLMPRGRGRIKAIAAVYIYGADDEPRVWSTASSYGVGDSIGVRWSGAPGQNLDWVGLFRCQQICGGPGAYLAYRYTRTDIEGLVFFGSHAYLGEGSAPWPLPPGRYIARLFVDDSYHAIGKSNRFTIKR